MSFEEILVKLKERNDKKGVKPYCENMTEIGKFTYLRTYSRYIPSLKRRENWRETVERAVAWSVSLAETTENELFHLFDAVYNLHVQLSGRTLWTGGTEVSQKYPLSNFNCTFSVIECIDDLCDLFYLSMLGSGVGFSLEEKYVRNFPLIRFVDVIHADYNGKPKSDRSEHSSFRVESGIGIIEVGDSKEGWTQALKMFFEFHTNPMYNGIEELLMDYDSVRPKGERLNTFGGFASGHEYMKKMFEKISNVIECHIGEFFKLEPIDLLDICNIIGENVVSGGVRRTAQISLFDNTQKELIGAKAELYQNIGGNWVENEKIIHRRLSNNSVIYYEKPTLQAMSDHINLIRDSGEPAFINGQEAKRRFEEFQGVNPCCLDGDSKILTAEGYKKIKDVVGDVELINKDGNVSYGRVWKTGEKEVFKVVASGRELIRATNDHRFMNVDGDTIELGDVVGHRIMPHVNFPTHHNNYLKYGFIQGDGTLLEDGRLYVSIGEKDDDILPLFNLTREMSDVGKKHAFYLGMNKKIHKELNSIGFASGKILNRHLPMNFNHFTNSEKASFLCGLYSANGSVIGSYRIAIKSINRTLIEQIQYSLAEDFGIDSYITTNKSKVIKWDNGDYESKESYDLNIGTFGGILKFAEEIGFIHTYKAEKLRSLILSKSPKVTKIESCGIVDVYDFNEPITNWGIVNGFVTHNCEILLRSKECCNLSAVDLALAHKDGLYVSQIQDLFCLATRHAYRITTLDLELPKWREVLHEDRLLGVSISGLVDYKNMKGINNGELASDLRAFRLASQTSMETYADFLGLSHSKNVTCIKPTGSQSLLGGASAGVHNQWGEYFIRRIRLSSFDPIFQAMFEMGYNMVLDTGSTDTYVVEFPCKSTQKRDMNDISAIEQLEMYKLTMENYTDQNTSCTINVGSTEWDDVKSWMSLNWDSVVGVSFLHKTESYYPLLPYETITKETYEEMVKVQPVFKPNVVDKHDDTGEEFDLSNEKGCANGSCPIR